MALRVRPRWVGFPPEARTDVQRRGYLRLYARDRIAILNYGLCSIWDLRVNPSPSMCLCCTCCKAYYLLEPDEEAARRLGADIEFEHLNLD